MLGRIIDAFQPGGEGIVGLLMWVLCFFFSISVHEVCHGIAAYKLGDDTAKRAGRLTLNPVPHIDLWGTVCMFVTGFGWAKAVPVNPLRFNRKYTMRTGMAITSLAGPLSNFLLAFISMAIWFAVFNILAINSLPQHIHDTINLLFINMVRINIVLGVFNLVPIPPLDGSKIVAAILPDRVYYQLMSVERFGFIILFALLNLSFFNEFLTSLVIYVFQFYTYILTLIPFLR